MSVRKQWQISNQNLEGALKAPYFLEILSGLGFKKVF